MIPITIKKIYNKDGLPTGEEQSQHLKPELSGMGKLLIGLIMLLEIIDQVFW